MLSYSMDKRQMTKAMRPPPLMFSWEIYEFFKLAEAAARR